MARIKRPWLCPNLSVNPDRTRLGPSGPPASPPLLNIVRAVYSQYGCDVYVGPSRGGVIARSNCDIVELAFLGWDPSANLEKETRSLDHKKEDMFCDQLRKIGGQWWPNRRRFVSIEVENGWSDDPTDEELSRIYVSWPAIGGVSVLEGLKEEIEHNPGMSRLITKMEERCRLMKDRLEATFYEDPKMYRGFATWRSWVLEVRSRV